MRRRSDAMVAGPLIWAFGCGLALLVGAGVLWARSHGGAGSSPGGDSAAFALLAVAGATGAHFAHLLRLSSGLRSGLNLSEWLHQSVLAPIVGAVAGVFGVGVLYGINLLFFEPTGGNRAALALFSALAGATVVLLGGRRSAAAKEAR